MRLYEVAEEKDLNPTDIDAAILEDHHINFEFATGFDVDAVFGINTRNNEDMWINFYADYDPGTKELKVSYCVESDEKIETFDYEPDEKEKDMLLSVMDQYAKDVGFESIDDLWSKENVIDFSVTLYMDIVETIRAAKAGELDLKKLAIERLMEGCVDYEMLYSDVENALDRYESAEVLNQCNLNDYIEINEDELTVDTDDDIQENGLIALLVPCKFDLVKFEKEHKEELQNQKEKEEKETEMEDR